MTQEPAFPLFVFVRRRAIEMETGLALAGFGSAASLMFGLGMNNNGACLVLASLTLSDHPSVMLPIIIYNLLQHLVASVVDKVLSRGAEW